MNAIKPIDQLAILLGAWCDQHGLPPPQPEYRFALSIGRKWRFDYAWPERLLAFEVEGVIIQGGGGRHQRKDGFEKDCEKYAAALTMGWRVLRLTPRQIKKGMLLVCLEKLMGVTKDA
jgi:hypothetical protein